MSVKHHKLDDGKVLRETSVDMAEVINEKLSNKEMLETHDAQIDVYIIKTGEVVDRKFMFYDKALQYGKEIKAEFSDLGYKIIQIVE